MTRPHHLPAFKFVKSSLCILCTYTAISVPLWRIAAILFSRHFLLAGLCLTGSFHQPKSESPATDAPEIGPNGLISSNHHCCEQHQQCSEHYYGTTTAGLGHVDTITSVSAEHLAQQLSETYTCLQIPSTASEGFDLSSRNSWPKLGGQGSSPAFDEDTAGMDGACCGELSASWHDHLDATQDPLALGAGTSMDPGQPSHVGMVCSR